MIQNCGFDTLRTKTAYVNGVMWGRFHYGVVNKDDWPKQRIQELHKLQETYNLTVFTVFQKMKCEAAVILPCKDLFTAMPPEDMIRIRIDPRQFLLFSLHNNIIYNLNFHCKNKVGSRIMSNKFHYVKNGGRIWERIPNKQEGLHTPHLHISCGGFCRYIGNLSTMYPRIKF
jgi:hypothetical protein